MYYLVCALLFPFSIIASQASLTQVSYVKPRISLHDHFCTLRNLNSNSYPLTQGLITKHTIALIKEIICLGYPIDDVDPYFLVRAAPEEMKNMLQGLRQELRAIQQPHPKKQIIQNTVDTLESHINAAQQQEKNKDLRLSFVELAHRYIGEEYLPQEFEKILKFMKQGADCAAVEDDLLLKARPEKLLAFTHNILTQQDKSEETKTVARTLQEHIESAQKRSAANSIEPNSMTDTSMSVVETLSNPHVSIMTKLSMIHGNWGGD